jgi:H+/Cl- antiporter ClcA
MKKHITEQTVIFFSVVKWVFLSSFVGVVIGAVVTLFLKILKYSENSREFLPFEYYYLLPFALVATIWLIKKFAPSAEGHGTEKVIEAVHKNYGKIDVKVIPIKTFATVLTIFAGGSVGKEGPGAQIGAGVSSLLSTIFNFSKEDRKKLVICGISAGFATVFGTPIAGAIFGVEVLVIGVIFYDVLLPSFIAGFAAFTTAQLLGVHYTYYDIRYYENISLDLVLIFKVVIAGIIFGVISDFVITTVSRVHKLIKKIELSNYLKAFIAGVVIILLTKIFGEHYIGLGLEEIKSSLVSHDNGLPWYAFILKTFFTAITLGAGGSGGIITPIFYIGATSGHTVGSILSPEHVELFAALGFTSVVAATTNAPIAATIMAVELFGLDIAHYAAISAVMSFLLSGHRSIFPSQILAMKKSDIVCVDMGKEIENAEVDVETNKIIKVNKDKMKLLQRRIKIQRERAKKRKKRNIVKRVKKLSKDKKSN